MIPNLYIKDGCFTISIHYKMVVSGSRQVIFSASSTTRLLSRNPSKMTSHRICLAFMPPQKKWWSHLMIPVFLGQLQLPPQKMKSSHHPNQAPKTPLGQFESRSHLHLDMQKLMSCSGRPYPNTCCQVSGGFFRFVSFR